jgi:hypothetical protein
MRVDDVRVPIPEGFPELSVSVGGLSMRPPGKIMKDPIEPSLYRRIGFLAKRLMGSEGR